MSNKADNSKVSFLDLPPEIRNVIYSLALTVGTPTAAGEYAPPRPVENSVELFERHHAVWHLSLSPNILISCKTIHQEATPILYGTNQFNMFEYTRTRSFLTTIGTSRQYLRRVGLKWKQTQIVLKKALTLLKDAKNLQVLRIDKACSLNFRNPESMAIALGPLVRHMHRKRPGTNAKSALEVLEFGYEDFEMWTVWSATEFGKQVKREWDAFGERTREILQASLK